MFSTDLAAATIIHEHTQSDLKTANNDVLYHFVMH